MTKNQLAAWRKRMSLSHNRAAAELDVSINRWRRMINGESDIPRHIALACAWLEEHPDDLTAVAGRWGRG